MADHHLGQSNAASSAEEKRTTRQKGARQTERQDANEGPARFAISARRLPIMLGGLILAVLLVLWLWPREKDEKEASKETAAEVEGEPNEVALTPEAMKTAGIEIGQVTERQAVALLSVAGAVEANAEREQTIAPLVAGQVATVNVSLGQRVERGGVLATIESQQVAELAGELLEAKSKLSLSTANVERVRMGANRAGVISAKAKLDLAEKNLARQRRLFEIGADSAKDVQAAEAEHAAARVSVERLRQALVAIGTNPDQESANASITVTAPITGVITKRAVNPGVGVKEGDTLFAIANLTTVWVMANVPEAQVSRLRVGARAQVKSPAGDEGHIAGRVNFIDSQVNTETHTVRVRMEAPNPGERLKAGMFVEVGFPDAISGGAPGAM